MPTPQEEIKARLDLIDLIREYVPIVQVGANWKARCPFHDEKSASFMVSQPKQIWHCFGCTEGGDHFTFIMKMENVEFPEALELLAKKAGIELPKHQNVVSTNQKESVRSVLNIAQTFFTQSLRPRQTGQAGSGGDAAWEYLTKTRAITEKTMQEFGLGFAPSSWDALTSHMLVNNCAPADILASGLVVQRSASRQGGTPFYDRFRGRVMFPIHDARGELVGFGGRLLEGSPAMTNRKTITEEPKYLNSPQTLLYDKRSLLYGLHKARDGVRHAQSVIILEGYMDVIASHQAGVPNAVATCGTALTLQHMQLIKRYTSTVILAFDMDAAGMNASQRGVDLLLNSELKIGMMRIPPGFGKDADECIRKDPEVWRSLSGTFRSFLEVLWERQTLGQGLSSLALQEKISKEFVPFVAKVGSRVEQAYWVKKMSDAFGYPQETIKGWLSGALLKMTALRSSTPEQSPTPTLDTDQAFVGLLILTPQAVNHPAVLSVTPAMLKHPDSQQWFTDWKQSASVPVATNEQIVTSWFTHIVAATELLYSALTDEEKEQELERISRSIRTRFYQQELVEIQRQLREVEQGNGGADSDPSRIATLLERAQQIHQEMALS